MALSDGQADIQALLAEGDSGAAEVPEAQGEVEFRGPDRP
jgi:hypothetical protein